MSDNSIMTQKEIARFYKWSIWARPFMIYSFTSCMVAMTATLAYMLLMGKTTINESSALIIVIFSTLAPLVVSIVLGKAYERSKGVDQDDNIPIVQQAPIGSPSNPIVSLSNLAEITDPSKILSDDPMEILNALKLDDFMPVRADDKPVIP